MAHSGANEWPAPATRTSASVPATSCCTASTVPGCARRCGVQRTFPAQFVHVGIRASSQARHDCGVAATIDLNVDAGESYGPWVMGDDAAMFERVTTVNVAAGFHAGDPGTIRRTIELAKAHGVAVGAHPGLPDRVEIGRAHV